MLVANHAGHADAVVLMASVPLRRINTVHPLAARDYFFGRRIVGFSVHALVNALPIDRQSRRARESLADARDLLADGRGVILFPEGSRTAEEDVAGFKNGVGVLLAGTNIPAIPAYISGSREVMPKGATRPHLAPMSVDIGPPVRFDELSANRSGYRRVAKELESRVRELSRRTRQVVDDRAGVPDPVSRD